MAASSDGRRRSLLVGADEDGRLREIESVQDRLDVAEAELAAVSALARKRGLAYLREEGEPLLEEMAILMARLRSLILDDHPAVGTLSRRAGLGREPPTARA